MVYLAAVAAGGKFDVRADGVITVELPELPGQPQPVDSHRLQMLEDRGWVEIGDAVAITDKGRYALGRYARRRSR